MAEDPAGDRPDDGGDPPCWAERFEPPAAPLSDAELAEVARRSADALVVADREGRITFWNDAAERLFGWTAAEALGQPLDLIIPARQRQAHWDGYARVVASGRTRYQGELLRVPALAADGARRSIAFTVTLLDDGEQVTGVAALIRDETERWAAEQQLRQRLRELEQAPAPDPGQS